MFDDPKKELQELEGQLLAAEMNDKEFEEFYDEVLEEFGPKAEPNGATASTVEPPIRNFANGYGKAPQTTALGNDGDEILPEGQSVSAPKGIRGLVILACIESVAIAGLAVYWFFHFL